ncbi:hypothetical protein HYS50_01330 [Candidatus Woesearchaeota archaeon]|nr:hypothetical protein [Candidatus Woesearchaeota archaeon]
MSYPCINNDIKGDKIGVNTTATIVAPIIAIKTPNLLRNAIAINHIPTKLIDS